MTYIANPDAAICFECRDSCIPVPEEDTQFNTYYLSHCHSAELIDEDGQLWEADIQSGEPEP